VYNTNNGGKNGAKSNKPRGPEHTLGPLRHLPLSIQILLGAFWIYPAFMPPQVLV